MIKDIITKWTDLVFTEEQVDQIDKLPGLVEILEDHHKKIMQGIDPTTNMQDIVSKFSFLNQQLSSFDISQFPTTETYLFGEAWHKKGNQHPADLKSVLDAGIPSGYTTSELDDICTLYLEHYERPCFGYEIFLNSLKKIPLTNKNEFLVELKEAIILNTLDSFCKSADEQPEEQKEKALERYNLAQQHSVSIGYLIEIEKDFGEFTKDIIQPYIVLTRFGFSHEQLVSIKNAAGGGYRWIGYFTKVADLTRGEKLRDLDKDLFMAAVISFGNKSELLNNWVSTYQRLVKGTNSHFATTVIRNYKVGFNPSEEDANSLIKMGKDAKLRAEFETYLKEEGQARLEKSHPYHDCPVLTTTHHGITYKKILEISEKHDVLATHMAKIFDFAVSPKYSTELFKHGNLLALMVACGYNAKEVAYP